MRRFALALLPWLALTFLMAACGDNEEAPQAPTVEASAAVTYPLTVQRSDGKSITIEAAPQRIASLSPGATEVFYAIGAGPQLIATDMQSDYPVEAARTTKLDAFQPNLEAIAGVEADIIFLANNQDNVVEALDALGKTVLYVEVPDDLAGVIEQVRLLGRVTGHVDEGEALAEKMEARIKAVQDKLAGVTAGPRVFHELDNTLFTAAPDSFVGDLYSILKAQNIAAGAPTPYPQLTQEEVIARDPEVIVLADEEFGETPDAVKARPGWSAISAVKNDRIYGVDPDIVSRPGPRVVDGLEQLARLLYPERFS